MVYCTILFYHAIPDDKVIKFTKQMKILKQLTSTIPLDYDGPYKKKVWYSIVTFDDAFKSIIRNGLPEMSRLEIPFTVFIPAGHLGTNPGWLKNTGDENESEPILSIDELLGLPWELATFGSHSINHHNLKQVDYEKACTEIIDSKKILELHLNREIRYFSFPYGAYDSTLIPCCLEAGYKQIFTIIPEAPFEPLRNYVKGRIEVNLSDWTIEFILKILGGYGWKSHIRSMRAMMKN